LTRLVYALRRTFPSTIFLFRDKKGAVLKWWLDKKCQVYGKTGVVKFFQFLKQWLRHLKNHYAK